MQRFDHLIHEDDFQRVEAHPLRSKTHGLVYNLSPRAACLLLRHPSLPTGATYCNEPSFIC